jgi:DNA-binding transcriptional LysR family regulator
MDRLDAMTAFVTVADLRGFAPAARRLGVSPSAVTRMVAALEERLEIRLLQRTTRSVTLTDAGARYLERARRILADVGEAEDSARAERSVPAGRLVVAAPSVFGRREVAPLMCEFLARYPAVSGELTLADRMVNLVEEGVDVAVRIGVLQDSSLHARRVGETRRVVVGAPAYFARRKKPRVPDDLAAHAIIQFTSLTPIPEWRFVRGNEEQRVSFSPRFVTNSADAAIGHAERGGGLTMVLAYQVIDALQAGRLEVVLPKYEPPPRPIQLVYPGSRLLSANIRAFIELAVTTRDWSFVEL